MEAPTETEMPETPKTAPEKAHTEPEEVLSNAARVIKRILIGVHRHRQTQSKQVDDAELEKYCSLLSMGASEIEKAEEKVGQSSTRVQLRTAGFQRDKRIDNVISHMAGITHIDFDEALRKRLEILRDESFQRFNEVAGEALKDEISTELERRVDEGSLREVKGLYDQALQRSLHGGPELDRKLAGLYHLKVFADYDRMISGLNEYLDMRIDKQEMHEVLAGARTRVYPRKDKHLVNVTDVERDFAIIFTKRSIMPTTTNQKVLMERFFHKVWERELFRQGFYNPKSGCLDEGKFLTMNDEEQGELKNRLTEIKEEFIKYTKDGKHLFKMDPRRRDSYPRRTAVFIFGEGIESVWSGIREEVITKGAAYAVLVALALVVGHKITFGESGEEKKEGKEPREEQREMAKKDEEIKKEEHEHEAHEHEKEGEKVGEAREVHEVKPVDVKSKDSKKDAHKSGEAPRADSHKKASTHHAGIENITPGRKIVASRLAAVEKNGGKEIKIWNVKLDGDEVSARRG